METNSTLVILALIMALGLVTVVSIPPANWRRVHRLVYLVTPMTLEQDHQFLVVMRILIKDHQMIH